MENTVGYKTIKLLTEEKTIEIIEKILSKLRFKGEATYSSDYDCDGYVSCNDDDVIFYLESSASISTKELEDITKFERYSDEFFEIISELINYDDSEYGLEDYIREIAYMEAETYFVDDNEVMKSDNLEILLRYSPKKEVLKMYIDYQAY